MAWNGSSRLAKIDGVHDARNFIDILRNHLFESASYLNLRDETFIPTRQKIQTYDANN